MCIAASACNSGTASPNRGGLPGVPLVRGGTKCQQASAQALDRVGFQGGIFLASSHVSGKAPSRASSPSNSFSLFSIPSASASSSSDIPLHDERNVWRRYPETARELIQRRSLQTAFTDCANRSPSKMFGYIYPNVVSRACNCSFSFRVVRRRQPNSFTPILNV